MPTARTLLRIDEERAASVIEKYLQTLREQNSANGVMIGLSGGIDSATLAALAVRSLGKDSVSIAYLYDRDSNKEVSLSSRLAADWLGLELEIQNIEPAMRESGVYKSWVAQITNVSPMLNRAIVRLYRLMRDTTSLMSTSSTDSIRWLGSKAGSLIQRPVRLVAIGFSRRHVYRGEVLQKETVARNLLLLSSANRTEYMTGWCSKGGIDDLPIQPLVGLYKTQIRQLAEYLGLPEKIRFQPPSADMMQGITDEFVRGITYNKIDIALDYLEGGLSRNDVDSAGITDNDLRIVREMKRASNWKRVSPRALLPVVDGGSTGDFRVKNEG